VICAAPHKFNSAPPGLVAYLDHQRPSQRGPLVGCKDDIHARARISRPLLDSCTSRRRSEWNRTSTSRTASRFRSSWYRPDDTLRPELPPTGGRFGLGAWPRSAAPSAWMRSASCASEFPLRLARLGGLWPSSAPYPATRSMNFSGDCSYRAKAAERVASRRQSASEAGSRTADSDVAMHYRKLFDVPCSVDV